MPLWVLQQGWEAFLPCLLWSISPLSEAFFTACDFCLFWVMKMLPVFLEVITCYPPDVSPQHLTFIHYWLWGALDTLAISMAACWCIDADPWPLTKTLFWLLSAKLRGTTRRPADADIPSPSLQLWHPAPSAPLPVHRGGPRPWHLRQGWPGGELLGASFLFRTNGHSPHMGEIMWLFFKQPAPTLNSLPPPKYPACRSAVSASFASDVKLDVSSTLCN